MADRWDALTGRRLCTYEDLALLICGEHLGAGINRTVFASRLNAEQVIKLEIESNDRFQNVVEWQVWSVVQDDKNLSKWFAPCIEISGLGCWLIQRRTKPIAKKDLPQKVPTLFTDLKADNWGWLDGRPVCHDYGTIMCRLFGSHSHRLRSADWSD